MLNVKHQHIQSCCFCFKWQVVIFYMFLSDFAQTKMNSEANSFEARALVCKSKRYYLYSCCAMARVWYQTKLAHDVVFIIFHFFDMNWLSIYNLNFWWAGIADSLINKHDRIVVHVCARSLISSVHYGIMTIRHCHVLLHTSLQIRIIPATVWGTFFWDQWFNYLVCQHWCIATWVVI